MVVLTIT